MLKREIVLHPAHDMRDKELGIHGVNLCFYVRGEKGVFQFIVYTNWQLPHVQEEINQMPIDRRFPYFRHLPQPSDVGYHAYGPQYEGQDICLEHCSLLNDLPCYYAGSTLEADDLFEVLTTEGSNGVWRELEARYVQQFGEE